MPRAEDHPSLLSLWLSGLSLSLSFLHAISLSRALDLSLSPVTRLALWLVVLSPSVLLAISLSRALDLSLSRSLWHAPRLLVWMAPRCVVSSSLGALVVLALVVVLVQLPSRCAASAQKMYTLTPGTAQGFAFNAQGQLVFSDGAHACVRAWDFVSQTLITVVGSCGPSNSSLAHSVDDIGNPYGIAFDSAGNLYFADSMYHTISMVASGTNAATLLAGSHGNSGYSGDGVAASSALFNTPKGLSIDPLLNTLYIADTGNHVIRSITLNDGMVHLVSGTPQMPGNGNGMFSSIVNYNYPDGVAWDATNSRLVIADTGNHYIRQLRNGVVQTLYNFPMDQPTSVWVDNVGTIYASIASIIGGDRIVVTITVSTAVQVAGGGAMTGEGIAPTEAMLDPAAALTDSNGVLYIGDRFTGSVRVVGLFSPPILVSSPSSTSVVAGSSVTFTSSATSTFLAITTKWQGTPCVECIIHPQQQHTHYRHLAAPIA